MEERRTIIVQRAEERSKQERNGIKYTEAYNKIIKNLNELMETNSGNHVVVNEITRIITDTKPKLEGGKKTKRQHNKNQNKKSNKKHR